jgi:hypothetical protein
MTAILIQQRLLGPTTRSEPRPHEVDAYRVILKWLLAVCDALLEWFGCALAALHPVCLHFLVSPHCSALCCLGMDELCETHRWC